MTEHDALTPKDSKNPVAPFPIWFYNHRSIFQFIYNVARPIIYTMVLVYAALGSVLGYFFQAVDPSQLSPSDAVKLVTGLNGVFNMWATKIFINQFTPLILVLFAFFYIVDLSFNIVTHSRKPKSPSPGGSSS